MISALRRPFDRPAARRGDRVLVVGAGLSGLSAADALLQAGVQVTIVDAFPVPGGRVASFDVQREVAGLLPGDVVEHGLHAFFQHYHGLYDLMTRAGLSKPPFATGAVHFFRSDLGHFAIDGGPGRWLVNALSLPPELGGRRAVALSAFARLVAALPGYLRDCERTDRLAAREVLRRHGVPEAAIEHVFAPCMYSLTSLPIAQLSALEMLRWMSRILPDPRMRSLPGGGSSALCQPILESLCARGADARLGVEVTRIGLAPDGRARLALAQAPDRTGVRHVLVPGFRPAPPPDPERFDAVIACLPPDRLLAVCDPSARRFAPELFGAMERLDNVHPLTIRLWFERPIAAGPERYILSSGTLVDVLRPTAEPSRRAGIHLVDALVENVATHLPELGYDGERYLAPGAVEASIVERVLDDLEAMFPGQIRGNRVLRRFLHTRQGVIACRPGAWSLRPPSHVGSDHFVLAGDWTRQPYGVCMEGAVASGRIAARTLLDGRQHEPVLAPFSQVAYSLKSLFDLSD